MFLSSLCYPEAGVSLPADSSDAGAWLSSGEAATHDERRRQGVGSADQLLHRY